MRQLSWVDVGGRWSKVGLFLSHTTTQLIWRFANMSFLHMAALHAQLGIHTEGSCSLHLWARWSAWWSPRGSSQLHLPASLRLWMVDARERRSRFFLHVMDNHEQTSTQWKKMVIRLFLCYEETCSKQKSFGKGFKSFLIKLVNTEDRLKAQAGKRNKEKIKILQTRAMVGPGIRELEVAR